jgi:hypothetical protein
MLQLDCNHIKVVHAKKSNQILKLIFNYNIIFDALLSSLLDPLEGLSMLNCGKLELGGALDFQH